jgi:hypothetical protein
MGIKDHWTDVTGELSKGLAQLTKPVQTATLTMAHAVAGPAGAAAGVTAVRQGPAIHIEQVILKDQTDMRAFMNMADFYIQQGRVS